MVHKNYFLEVEYFSRIVVINNGYSTAYLNLSMWIEKEYTRVVLIFSSKIFYFFHICFLNINFEIYNYINL